MTTGAAGIGATTSPGAAGIGATTSPGAAGIGATTAPEAPGIGVTIAPGAAGIEAPTAPGAAGIEATIAPEAASIDATIAPGAINSSDNVGAGANVIDLVDAESPCNNSSSMSAVENAPIPSGKASHPSIIDLLDSVEDDVEIVSKSREGNVAVVHDSKLKGITAIAGPIKPGRHRRIVLIPRPCGGLIVGAKFHHMQRIAAQAGGNCTIRFPPRKADPGVNNSKESLLIVEADSDQACEAAENELIQRIHDILIDGNSRHCIVGTGSSGFNAASNSSSSSSSSTTTTTNTSNSIGGSTCSTNYYPPTRAIAADRDSSSSNGGSSTGHAFFRPHPPLTSGNGASRGSGRANRPRPTGSHTLPDIMHSNISNAPVSQQVKFNALSLAEMRHKL